jgi:hypothetical protein
MAHDSARSGPKRGSRRMVLRMGRLQSEAVPVGGCPTGLRHAPRLQLRHALELQLDDVAWMYPHLPIPITGPRLGCVLPPDGLRMPFRRRAVLVHLRWPWLFRVLGDQRHRRSLLDAMRVAITVGRLRSTCCSSEPSSKRGSGLPPPGAELRARRRARAEVRLASALALGLLGCSPVSSASDSDAGVGCLFCSDATDEAPLVVQVKGEIDRVCANIECHGSDANVHAAATWCARWVSAWSARVAPSAHG